MLLAPRVVENSVRNWGALRQEAEIHTHLMADWRPTVCPLLGVHLAPCPVLAIGDLVRGDA